ncbi:patatin-like protein [Amycolatopsis sp. H20-H5]|uniref:patatin-like protein n=1 Tax=Amycolatopsis sp. H20-H5 TaxID=3046309 RepID=UPI002DBF43B8|nr:patatin-like protein [Amycolatopsis sp. H20-H5]MEC3979928.1 patatin-like protein [Amycolatopsis sp. H20-H5]
MAEQTTAPWPQEIRLAMTMVGGSSLAVWMGGIATETSNLLHESRAADGTAYRKLLDLLNATVSIDVLTGTSAGGINAACLGLAEAYGSTPAVLRDTWIETGSFENLIREPGERVPRSILNGDKVLLEKVRAALDHIVAGCGKPEDPPDITVLLTGTMIDGETTRFDDALGNLVRDTEHRLLFRFSGPLWTNDDVTAHLALAVRSTASFPGAFELSRMPVGEDCADSLHPDMAEYTDVARSHWLTDGGVLLNKPLRPALREIFERQSHADVRRLLLYVVPTGEREAEQVPCDAKNPPLLAGAMSRVVSTVMSQTITAELEDLTRHNDAVVRTRGTRVSLAAMGVRGGADKLVDPRLMDDYRERRVQEDATALVREATRKLDRADVGGPGRQWASGTSEQLRTAAAEGLSDELPKTKPGDTCTLDELVNYRTTALDDSVATGLQLLNAGFRLAISPAQAALLNNYREQLHEARHVAARADRLIGWVAEQDPPGPGIELSDWVRSLATNWAGLGRVEELRTAWPLVADALRAAAPILQKLAAAAPPDDKAADTVRTLLRWFGLPEAGDSTVFARLITLHIATRGLLAQPPSVDQRVDLVQVSADSRTLLDMARPRSWDKLTGMQADYFGAFYKASWRANDWMWGRIDGAGWLIQCLLDPKRLMQLRRLAGPEAFREQVRGTFTAIGWHPPCAEDGLSASDRDSLLVQLREELRFLGLDAGLGDAGFTDELPVSMPVTAMVLARSRQLAIAREELPIVGEWAEKDAHKDVGGNGKPSETFRKLLKDSPPVDDESARRAFQTCRISAERFEGELGSPLLTRTLVKAGATGINALTGATSMPKALQPVATFAQAAGRSAWWVTKGAETLGKPWNILAAAVTVLAGFVLTGQGGPVLQWVGLPVVAGALVFLVVSLLNLRKAWRALFVVLGVLAVACLLFAAFLPPVRGPFFGWLGDVVASWRRGEAPVWWLVVAALLILPALATPVTALVRVVRPRR